MRRHIYWILAYNMQPFNCTVSVVSPEKQNFLETSVYLPTNKIKSNRYTVLKQSSHICLSSSMLLTKLPASKYIVSLWSHDVYEALHTEYLFCWSLVESIMPAHPHSPTQRHTSIVRTESAYNDKSIHM